MDVGVQFRKATVSDSFTSVTEDTTSDTMSQEGAGSIHAICNGVSGAKTAALWQWETLAEDHSITVKTPTYECTYNEYTDNGP